jgi:hypothetical protein
MSFDFNTFEMGTASPAEVKPRVEPRVVDRLRATLRPTNAPPDWQQPALRYPVTGLSAADVTKAQGRLNAIGRRYNVEFSVKTQRVDEQRDGVTLTYIEAYAVPKRTSKPRGKRG